MICVEARKDQCHPLYTALWIDHDLKLRVFTAPAPIWPGHTSAERDQYWLTFKDDFQARLACDISVKTENC